MSVAPQPEMEMGDGIHQPSPPPPPPPPEIGMGGVARPDAPLDAPPDAPPAPPPAAGEDRPPVNANGVPMVFVPLPLPPFVDRPPKKAGRRKAGEPRGKPGKPSWIWGSKFRFFNARKEQWLLASETGTVGAFYTKMAKLYVLKYGCDMKDHQDLAFDTEDPPDWAANQVVNARLAPDATQAIQKFHQSLRDRMGQWYRGQYSALLKQDRATFGKLLGGLAQAMPRKPRRPQLIHFYSSRYYDERVEPQVVTRMQKLEKRATHTGEALPHRIVVQNEMTKEVWEEETEIFQEETMKAMEREYEVILQGWRVSLADSPARTPEEFSSSLKSAAHYLQPFCDAIEERFGMVVSLMLCGPIGDRGGRIEMRSIHSGKTRGLVEKDWPMHDPQGFRAVESSMVDFAHHVFSQSDCEARRTEVQDPEYVGSADTSAPAPVAPAPITNSATRTTATMTSAAVRATAVTAAEMEITEDVRASMVVPTGETTGSMGDELPNGDAAGENRREDEAGGSGEGEREDSEADVAIARCWHRSDREKWTDELNQAHEAFERGKKWGIEWATCVERFYDFESAWGFSDDGPKITTEGRPGAVAWWLGRARKWNKIPGLGELGAVGKEKTYVEAWWKWWRGMQPKEREWEEGRLSMPENCNWDSMAGLHGKNGLLQVMAALLWWGDKVGSGTDPIRHLGWTEAVGDVATVLHELLRPGLIAKSREAEGGNGTKKQAKGKRKRAEEDDEPGEDDDDEAVEVGARRRSARQVGGNEGEATESGKKKKKRRKRA